jgi:GWxTD domain-containing protein
MLRILCFNRLLCFNKKASFVIRAGWENIFYLLSGALVACSPELAPRNNNLNVHFAPDTGLAYELQPEKDSLRIFLKITDQTTIAALQKPDRHLPYTLSKSYDRAGIYRRDSVLFVNKHIRELPGNAAVLTLALAKSVITFPSVLILRVPQLSAVREETLLDIPLASPNQKILVTDSTGQVPLFRSYINPSEKFTVTATADSSVTVRQFPGNFTPAIPPMAIRKNIPAPTLKAQSKEVYSGNQPLQLTQSGIYLIESGGRRTGLLVETGSFPELTSAEELIEPLIYLTSSAERQNLYQAPEPKRAVDAFWLGIARQDQNIGKSLIREYYGRVEKANQYFSSHKAGWRTDRGMIYIVFGAPAYVNRTWDREEWVYLQNSGPGNEVKFVFSKKPNTFTQNHYELVRSAAYEYVWYNQVDQWRKGIIGMPATVTGPSGKRNRIR